MKKELNKEKVKEFVKDRYGKIAKENTLDRGQSCECCGAAPAVEQAEAIGYSKKELEKIPDSAIIGLGCGNPVALATLSEGECKERWIP